MAKKLKRLDEGEPEAILAIGISSSAPGSNLVWHLAQSKIAYLEAGEVEIDFIGLSAISTIDLKVTLTHVSNYPEKVRTKLRGLDFIYVTYGLLDSEQIESLINALRGIVVIEGSFVLPQSLIKDFHLANL